ncbi:hypothetical protein, partial [Escherichia coli]|uniref:hypothetical protein n=1 Tax=Escherichia coli TaxID=562 RepID=UPI00201F905F
MAPTRMVLERLATFPNVAAAVRGARATPPGVILPRLEQRDGVTGLVTDAVPGFPASWEILTPASATSRGLDRGEAAELIRLTEMAPDKTV